MPFSVIIPARYASTRLPGKPLLDLGGKPMIQRVFEQALRSSAQRVLVATDDERILQVVEGFDGKGVMTSAAHPSGTDRLQEVCVKERLADDDIVVNVQGDEPLVPPTVIDQVARNLEANPHAGVATLCEPIVNLEDVMNPNVVKVVRSARSMALYFSRAPIPWDRRAFSAQPVRALPPTPMWWRHIGIYAYRVSLLHRFVGWEPAPLERAESLEQLRLLHYGIGIHVDEAVALVPGGVDTPEDFERVKSLL
ncbi:MAG: 3-deoxy-manno-octulosonate cytidylyltransferase [Pseudomonadales bacterium]